MSSMGNLGYEMLVHLTMSAEIEEELFIKEKARFTSADGIFDVDAAYAWFEHPARSRDDGARL